MENSKPVAHVDKRTATAGSICWTPTGRALNLEHGTPLFVEQKPPAGLVPLVEFLEKELPDEAYEYGDKNIRNAWIWLKDLAEKSKRKDWEK
ncbi:hypothetical protein [Pectobacterium polaris]|uniref:hypothetical protein n=1 Tax=Pectobacterium polaris TaxID=2042057 RepID=UPI0032EFEE8F